MITRASMKNRQGGAVAVMVGIGIVVLVGFLALVLDLGHVYVAKTELQNAADAAALSGAKELDGMVGTSCTSSCTPSTSCTGVTRAVCMAIATAAQNSYDFSKPVNITIADISVGNCPSDACMVLASTVTTDAAAANKTFLKVDTGPRQLGTWVAPIFNLVTGGNYSTTSTFGMAVAGRYVVDITPIAICQLPSDPDITNELGYKRGVSYRVADANYPHVGPGTMYWLDPESATPGVCPVTNTNDTRPYICVGKTAYTPIVGQTVNTNTGISDAQLASLDSRFDDYPSQGKCDPATAPPDTNVKEYNACLSTANDGTCNVSNTTAGSPSKWMEPDPTRQSIFFDTYAGKYQPIPYASSTVATFANNYGVLWSAFRPTIALGDATDAAVSARWTTLYKAPASAAINYPQTSPYAQTSGDFFKEPPLNPLLGKPNRRVLNLVIVDCTTAGGNCRPATVMGVGKFFMQKKSNTPSDKEIYVEFGGLLSTPFPPSDIRLYR